MDVRGVLLSFRERQALAKQKPEGLVSAAVDICRTAFNVRFRPNAVSRVPGTERLNTP
ncbi:hypothetical protein D3C87_922450 [compost metagenome]